ncbi:hypothetical protein OG426_54035 [Streptomyces canus]|uniref:hypothetical protein n=1 Tax=Streptomyces canus TaxID=58343 RepID=UPI0038707307|nr:hypothetical protein OG426_54035 [Streptomyces canus]
MPTSTSDQTESRMINPLLLEPISPLPVEALHGIGPRQAAALRDYGIHWYYALTGFAPP